MHRLQKIAGTILLLAILCFTGSLHAQAPAKLDIQGQRLLADLGLAHEAGRTRLRTLLARQDLDAIIAAQDAPGRLLLLLQMSRAQRMLEPDLQPDKATYWIQALNAKTASTPPLLTAALLAESILVARRVDAPDDVQVKLASDLLALTPSQLISGTHSYGEKAGPVVNVAQRIAQKAKRSDLKLALIERGMEVEVAESGEGSPRHASALMDRAWVRNDDGAALADFQRAAGMLEHAIQKGQIPDIYDAIHGFNFFAEFGRRRPETAREVTSMAMRLIRAATDARPDADNRAALARETLATARLLRMQSRRVEQVALLAQVDAWAAQAGVGASDRADLLKALGVAEALTGSLDGARLRLRTLESLRTAEEDEKKKIKSRASSLRWDIAAIEMSQGPPRPDAALQALLILARSPALGAKQAQDLLTRDMLSLPDRVAVLKAAYDNPALARDPEARAGLGVELARKQERLLDTAGALDTLAIADRGVRAENPAKRNLLALVAFHRGRLQFDTKAFADAERSFSASLATWRNQSPRDGLVAAHWLARAQLEAGATARATATLQGLQAINVPGDLAFTRSMAIASIDAEIKARQGSLAAATQVIMRLLLDFAGDVDDQKTWGPLPMWPFQVSMRAHLDEHKVHALLMATRQLLSLMDRACDADQGLMLALFQVQQLLGQRKLGVLGDRGAMPEQLLNLDDAMWGSDLLADLVVRSAAAGRLDLARLAWRLMRQQQAQSFLGLPRAAAQTAGSRSDPGLLRAAALARERALINARSAAEVRQVALGLEAPEGLMVPRFLQPDKLSPLPEGPQLELIVFKPSAPGGSCVDEARRTPHAGAFLVLDGELQHASLALPMDELRKREQAMLRALAAQRPDLAMEQAASLHSALLRPHLAALPAGTLTIRADTSVWDLPFAYLLWAGGQPRAVRLVSPGLTTSDQPNKPRSGIVVFAHPAYGEPRPGQASLAALPEGLTEARHIETAFNTGIELFKDKDASVASLLLLDKPALLHLATHGFIDERLRTAAGETPDRAARFAHALVSMRLALAHANENAPGLYANGVISSLGLATVDLRGTQLVVFSACDTGVATHGVGYLTTGLGLAAHLAGARTVLTTLWPVSAAASPVFMEQFYKNLAAGHAPSKALATTQAFMRDHSRFNAPLHWAGYVLSGDDVPLAVMSAAIPATQRPRSGID